MVPYVTLTVALLFMWAMADVTNGIELSDFLLDEFFDIGHVRNKRQSVTEEPPTPVTDGGSGEGSGVEDSGSTTTPLSLTETTPLPDTTEPSITTTTTQPLISTTTPDTTTTIPDTTTTACVPLSTTTPPAVTTTNGGSTTKEVRLTDAEARKQLADAGITVNKPKPKTSLENVRQATIDGIIKFKKACGCDMVVTGGTEPGHAAGEKSHGTGYKLDIRLNDCVTKYIKKNYKDIGKRCDGAQLYESPEGFIFALEPNHWDILFP